MLENVVVYVIGSCTLTVILILLSILGYLLARGEEHQKTRDVPKIAFAMALLFMILMITQAVFLGILIGKGNYRSSSFLFWLSILFNFIVVIFNFRTAFR